jgi:hypothetical protein
MRGLESKEEPGLPGCPVVRVAVVEDVSPDWGQSTAAALESLHCIVDDGAKELT